MTFEHKYAQPVDVEDDQSNVKVVPGNEWPNERVDVADLSADPGWVDGGWVDGENIAPVAPSTHQLSRRQAIINEATQLAYDALETFREAVDILSIIDINARVKYGDVLKRMTSAVEDFEKKL